MVLSLFIRRLLTGTADDRRKFWVKLVFTQEPIPVNMPRPIYLRKGGEFVHSA
jgi:hypothetical protein